MCGIAGIFDSGSTTEGLKASGLAMINALLHRGPDSGDTWIADEIPLLLGHRRLSIQDLSELGSQPMLSTSTRYCIVYNGEIYNFRELAVDLGKSGHHFTGHSDTEVILAAFEEWGLSAAIERFVGMFAFALWDSEERCLHLCRDRMGEKPLYYGWAGKCFYFASELKAIERTVDNSRLEINFSGLDGLLRYGYIPAPHSIYRGFYKLPPGCLLSLDIDQLATPDGYSSFADAAPNSPRRYWSVLETANRGLSHAITDPQEAVMQLDALLRRTVCRQMIADVKVGTFLSGGIDSTLVTAIAQHEADEKVRTYTIGYSEREYDESVYADRIAEHLGTDHLSLCVSPLDVLDVVPHLPEISDEPFADSSLIPAYLVSRLARQHVTVCLSGDGGDELFGGYNRYVWTHAVWKNISLLPEPLRKTAGRLLALPSPVVWDRLYRVLSGLGSSRQSEHKLVGLKMQKLANLMMQSGIYEAYDGLLSYWPHPETLMRKPSPHCIRTTDEVFPDTDSFLHRAMYFDQVLYLPGDNLAKVDRTSMAVSLETRLPLLSHEVVELSWQLPISMKVNDGSTKWLLRQLLDQYVPRSLIDRPKMGFSVPIDRWLRGELKEWAGDLLGTLRASRGNVLCEKSVRRVWDEHQSCSHDHSHRLWSVLMYLAWADKCG